MGWIHLCAVKAGRGTACRAAVIGAVMGILMASGCGYDSRECRHGADLLLAVGVHHDGWHTRCQTTRWWEAYGDAVVETVTRTGREVDIGLQLTEDATTAGVHLQLPEDVALPIAQGDAVWVRLVYECPWWDHHSVRIETPTGTLLLQGYDGGAYVDPPRACEDNGCGRVGYPAIEFAHPRARTDGRAPRVRLKQGGTATLSYGGESYRALLGTARTWVKSYCSDMEQTVLREMMVLVPSDS